MIEQLLRISKASPLSKYSSTPNWFPVFKETTKDKSPIEKAIMGGFTSQQFCFTFLAGYQAALSKMFPTIAPDRLKALCVSEANGNHPKSMGTTLVNNRITGIKTYITAGSDIQDLLVLCKTNELVNDRVLLKMVHIPSDAHNIEISDFDLAFMKEIKHGKLTLRETPIEDQQILEGDGFSQYAKPFRTLEDICVGAACHSMLLRQAIDHQWNESLRDRLLLNIYTLKNLITLPPSAQETILLLAAAEQNFEALLLEIEYHVKHHTHSSFQEDWETNKRLLAMSKKLKEIRLAKARKNIFGRN